MDKNITGRFIAELRKQKGFTQKELAEKLMVTDKAISRWETGKGLPDTSLLKPLGDVLGVSITLGAIALFKFDNAASLRKAMFVCSVISLLLSIVPLFLFGTVGMTAASYAVSCAILLSICLQAVANRKE